MIISASRRTDIPCYYSEWFYNRLKEGFVMVRNPYNHSAVTKVPLNPNVVDGIVFWTKNPLCMIPRLDELKDYNYYFQFTLTGYDTDIEKRVGRKQKEIIPTFKMLSEKIGKERVIWRYDPIFFTEKYSLNFHMKRFDYIASELSGYTEKCVISFLDMYGKVRKNMEAVGVIEDNAELRHKLAAILLK